MSSYPAPPFDAVTYLGMVLITLIVVPAAAWVFSARQPQLRKRWLAAGAGAMVLSGALAASGLLARTDIQPPLLQVLIIGFLVALLLQGLRKPGRRAARSSTLAAMVLLQVFRLPLEFLMLHAARVGVMPVEFSMVGYNLDVVTGALALPLGLALRQGWQVPRTLVWAWHLWGMACLCVIVVLAALTSPNVAYFGSDAAHISVWILRFPYVWLPTILVGVAVYGHLSLSIHLLGGFERAGGDVAASDSSRQP